MSDLAAQFSAEEKAFFGEEAIAEAIAGEAGAPAATEGSPPADGSAAAKQPEPKTEEKPADKPADKTVPLAALHEERTRRKELQDEIAKERDHRVRMEERFNQFVGALQRKPAEEQPKSVQEDPIAALERLERAHAEQQHLTAAQRQQAEAQRQLDEYVEQHETRFRAETPDYNDAVNFLIAHAANVYEKLGHTPQQVRQLVARDAQSIMLTSAQRGRSPAADAYQLAQAYGYAPKAAGATAGEGGAAAAKPPAGDVSAEEKMAMLEKGTAAAKSLSTPGGGNSELTLEALANMDDDEFNQISDSQWKKLWGAR